MSTSADAAPPKASRSPAGAAVLRDDVTESIRTATLAQLVEVGYSNCSIEAVARRAGVGKAAVYRRFATKAELVVAVVRHTVVPAADHDTGSLHGDVLAFLRDASGLLSDRAAVALFADLTLQAARVAELAQLLDEAIAEPRRKLLSAAFDRAIARGELSPALDRELALDVVPGALHWRMVVRRRQLTDVELQRLADASVAGIQALSTPA